MLDPFVHVHSIAFHRKDSTHILRNSCEKHLVDVGLSAMYTLHSTHTDITFRGPNSFLFSIKRIIRSSEYIQISGNQFKSFFFSVGPCKLKVKTVRAFDVHTHMIYRFLRIFHTRYTHERKHTHYLAIIFDPTIVILQWKSNTLRTL